jgi:pilus assembly protein CpaF
MAAATNPADPENLARLQRYLTEAIRRDLTADLDSSEALEERVIRLIKHSYDKTGIKLADGVRDGLFMRVFHDVIGLGPIQPFLDDADVAEVMVVGPDLIYIEKDGELIETGAKFKDEEHVLQIIDRILHPLGRRVDYDSPAADARLPDGSRVHAMIPPVAVDGPCITIRKFLPNKMAVEELIALGSLTENMAEFLRACVAARLNIVISGGTSSGKTTMLNVLSSFISRDERIVTIEDAVELQLRQRHVVRMETKNPNVDGSGAMDTRTLVRHSLRMRPDRIIVGEVRSGESLDMLQAMNTGHSGSLTTLHANTPRDVISRLETTCLMAGIDLPVLAIRKQIASAIDLIVHQARLDDGSRKTTLITEVAGMESDVVTLTDIFKFDQTGLDEKGKIQGELTATGIRPMFTPRLEVVGFNLSGLVFGAGTGDRWRTSLK